MTKPTAYSTDKNGITWLPIPAIRTDAGTQHRPALDEKAVEDYAQQMRAKEWNWRRSPIRITKEGEVHWLIGGFHRLAAAERADLKLVGCIVQPGTRRDAILASFSENSHHGVRLDNASKRNKVLTLLADEEWRAWSSHSIAKRCGVSHTFVEKLRVTVNADSDSTERTYVNKQGSVSIMETANIGKRSEKPADSPISVADLDSAKWYPFSLEQGVIVADAFDTAHDADTDPRYVDKFFAAKGEKLKAFPVYSRYKIASAFPQLPASPADPVRTLADLDPNRWYPVKLLANLIAFEAFETLGAVTLCPRYPIPWQPIRGDQLSNYPQYREYKIVPALPKVEVAAAATPPARPTETVGEQQPADPPAQPSASIRTYPMAAPGNVLDDKYYATISRLAQVYDEPFDDHSACLKDPRYPGNKPIYGQTLNHNSFFQTAHFRLVAPIIASNDTAPAASDIISNDVTPAVPACRMIYEPNDRFGDYVGGFEEQFPLDLDYWASVAHDGELPKVVDSPEGIANSATPAAPDAPAPTSEKSVAPETAQPADQPSATSSTPATAPSKATSTCQRCGKSVETTVKDFKANMRLCQECFDAAHPGWPKSAPEPQPVKPNHPSVKDDKFYVTDNRSGGKIITEPYDTFQEAHRHVVSPYDQRVESGKSLNTLIIYEHWVLVAPADGNGNSNGASKPSGTPFMDKSNNGDGKDTTMSRWEAQDVANGQAAQKIAGLNALDFRILVECNLVEVNEEDLRRLTKPLKALFIDAINFGTGKIDEATFGKVAFRTYVTAARKDSKVAQPTIA